MNGAANTFAQAVASSRDNCAVLTEIAMASLNELALAAHREGQMLDITSNIIHILPHLPSHQLVRVREDLGLSCSRELVQFGHGTIVGKLLESLATEKEESKFAHNVVRMVEIGVNAAGHAEFLLDALPQLRYIGVDPYSRNASHPGTPMYTKAMHRLLRCSGRAHILRMTSVDAADWIQNGSLDLVWIDGDHSYESALQDLRTWGSKVRKGGVIAGHDYHAACGVPKAVHEFFEELPAADRTINLAYDNTFFWHVP
eukprot:gnl/TRDRNA2_/TRDRNA2_150691_c3_seq1.p1 gnl/TRDRNA2_/TRDRNA2_150691_c3~~gnl/TRDRNA2_/TRDRNA2_150691_c3_seq1.p1  ORF type:complete len:297 (+),score=19.63 gnl/TRDRNA2_/TRDRNA2_150691_c3_seq1:122-892(+)